MNVGRFPALRRSARRLTRDRDLEWLARQLDEARVLVRIFAQETDARCQYNVCPCQFPYAGANGFPKHSQRYYDWLAEVDG